MVSGDSATTDGDGVPARFLVDFTGRTLMGTYRIEGKLAEGGMGTVYVAEDTNLGRRVVVKVPHARFLGEPGFRSRFRREIAELVRLEHPHVVRILARGEEEQVPYFVLQFLRGGSLEDRLKQGTQKPAEVLAWLDPIAKTLDYVHGRDVVHRDVKPANILFDEEGHVFLSDFGVSKALGRDDGGEKTEAGTGVGSAFYLAPEQGIGREVTPSADQYALASSVYEALTGMPPFGRGSVVEVLVKKQRDEPPPLDAASIGLPAAAAAAVLRALSRDPAARFPSCTAFAEEYARTVRGDGAGVGGQASTGARLAPRQRALLVAAGILALAGIGLATNGFGLGTPSAPPAPVVPVPSPVAAKPIRPPETLFRLVNPGEEPRVARRMRFRAGTTDRFTMRQRSNIKQRMTAQGKDPQRFDLTSLREQDAECRVVSVDEDGVARLAWTLKTGRALSEEGATKESAAAEQKELDAIGPMEASTTVGPLGGTLEFEAKSRDDLSIEAQRSYAGMQELLRDVSPSLPEEPIGVGAVWDVTQVATTFGIRTQQTVSHELVKVEGDRLFLKVRSQQTALPQDFTMLGIPENVKSTIEKFEAAASGDVVLDLTLPGPFGNDSTGTFDFSTTHMHEGAKVATVRVEVTFRLTIRRE